MISKSCNFIDLYKIEKRVNWIFNSFVLQIFKWLWILKHWILCCREMCLLVNKDYCSITKNKFESASFLRSAATTTLNFLRSIIRFYFYFRAVSILLTIMTTDLTLSFYRSISILRLRFVHFRKDTLSWWLKNKERYTSALSYFAWIFYTQLISLIVDLLTPSQAGVIKICCTHSIGSGGRDRSQDQESLMMKILCMNNGIVCASYVHRK